MNTPTPLPEPGWWLVMPDGSQYEARHCRTDHGPCSVSVADDAGCYFYSVSDDEVLWTPWGDVDSIHPDPEAAQARADALTAESAARMAAEVPALYPLDREARYAVTIRHRQGGDPFTPAMLAALSELLTASLATAGIRAAVTVEPATDPEARPCRECGEDGSAHAWHYDSSHTYDPEEA